MAPEITAKERKTRDKAPERTLAFISSFPFSSGHEDRGGQDKEDPGVPQELAPDEGCRPGLVEEPSRAVIPLTGSVGVAGWSVFNAGVDLGILMVIMVIVFVIVVVVAGFRFKMLVGATSSTS